MDELIRFLGAHPPFDALSEADLRDLAAAADVVDFTPGSEILDAFAAPSEAMFVVLTGRVELWNAPVAGGEDADEVLGTGGVFGFSALLSRALVGPLAIAAGPVRLVRIPASAVAPVFSSAAGVVFLAQNLTPNAVRSSAQAGYVVVDELIYSDPVLAEPSMTVTQVASLMTERNSKFAVVALDDGEYGLVTDASLRSRVTAEGLPSTTTIGAAMTSPAPWVVSGSLAAQALVELTDRKLDCLLILDREGTLRGIVAPDDFIVLPSAVGMSLREQIGRSDVAEQLVVLARRVPPLLGDLFRRGRSAAEVTTVNATLTDAVVRKALSLVFGARPDLDVGEMTWLSLGSNGRREPVLSSDIDAAVVFAPTVDSEERRSAYRSAFDAVAELLTRCGLSVDLHGATPGQSRFARTGPEWRTAAQQWMNSPLEGNAMMMTSLLLDARPVQGDPGLPVVNDVFGDMHRHPGTLRLLLAESLSNRARLRSITDVLARRGGTFDIKTHALRPAVDIARWAALAVGSTELSTGARLAAAAGSAMVPQEQAGILIEVYEVLQKIRLRYQLGQLDRGEPASDVISMRRLSPLDRSLIAQAVREIAAVQKRMANLSHLTPPEAW